MIHRVAFSCQVCLPVVHMFVKRRHRRHPISIDQSPCDQTIPNRWKRSLDEPLKVWRDGSTGCTNTNESLDVTSGLGRVLGIREQRDASSNLPVIVESRVVLADFSLNAVLRVAVSRKLHRTPRLRLDILRHVHRPFASRSQTDCAGQPWRTHSRISSTRQRTRLPRRIGRGVRPAARSFSQDDREIESNFATSVASIVNDSDKSAACCSMTTPRLRNSGVEQDRVSRQRSFLEHDAVSWRVKSPGFSRSKLHCGNRESRRSARPAGLDQLSINASQR